MPIIYDETYGLGYILGNFLKLDQTPPEQHVINGLPNFNEGITIYENKRIYLDGV